MVQTGYDAGHSINADLFGTDSACKDTLDFKLMLALALAGSSEAGSVDVHAVALFLFAQLYIRQVQRPEAMEIWPSSPGGVTPTEAAAAFGGSPSSPASSSCHLESGAAPASPARSNSSSSSQGSGRQHLQQGGEPSEIAFPVQGSG